MSTKTTTRPRSTRPALPALAGADQQDHRDMQPRLAHVRALQAQYAATIIAAGVFGADEAWSGVLAALAEADAAESYRALNGLFKRLEQASPNSTRILFPIPNHPDSVDFAGDVLTAHACSWGDAGFLLGLAVGMQLGPHALDGGAR